MGSHPIDGEACRSAQHRRGLSLVLAVGVHLLALWVLAYSISFQFAELPERAIEPKIVALAPRLEPPPPDVETLGPTDVVITTVPRFRPRLPTVTRQRRSGDPALAIWKYLCNRDLALSEATNVACPTFNFGSVDLGLTDPLNRSGDVGALFGPDTTTMSMDEVARKRGWAKPKMPWSQDGARAKGDDLGLPGHIRSTSCRKRDRGSGADLNARPCAGARHRRRGRGRRRCCSTARSIQKRCESPRRS